MTFEDKLCRMQKDVNSASAAYYAYVQFNNALCDPEVKKAADRAPSFWQTTRHSLQTTALITLAGIFDSFEGKTYSMDWLFFECFKYIGELENVGKNCNMPFERGDIQKLKDRLKPATTIYKDKIKPIRSRVIAHSERLTEEEINEIFGNMKHSEWESVCSTLESVVTELKMAYTEGVKIGSIEYKSNIGELMSANVDTITSQLVSSKKI